MNRQTNLPIPVKALITGLIVGTLDITAALIKYYISTGKNPLFIFQYIASGILGSEAFSGGTSIVVLGLLLHYTIALIFTVLFCLLYKAYPIISKNNVLSGICYGIIIWCIMNFIVVPLSDTPKSTFNIFNAIKELIILIVMIGIPLVFLANRFIFKRMD